MKTLKKKIQTTLAKLIFPEVLRMFKTKDTHQSIIVQEREVIKIQSSFSLIANEFKENPFILEDAINRARSQMFEKIIPFIETDTGELLSHDYIKGAKKFVFTIYVSKKK